MSYSFYVLRLDFKEDPVSGMSTHYSSVKSYKNTDGSETMILIDLRGKFISLKQHFRTAKSKSFMQDLNVPHCTWVRVPQISTTYKYSSEIQSSLRKKEHTQHSTINEE